MPANPVVRPETRPVVGLIVATAGLPLVHVPPGIAWLKVVVPPWHADKLPVTGLSRLIVSALVVAHPEGNV